MNETILVPLTTAQVDEIAERANAATPGPWESDGEHVPKAFPCAELVSKDPATVRGAWEDDEDAEGAMLNISSVSLTVLEPDERRQTVSDMNFIAHARADVPVLIATVREQQARIAALENERDAAQEMLRVAHECLTGVNEISRKVREDLAIEPPRPGPAFEDGV